MEGKEITVMSIDDINFLHKASFRIGSEVLITRGDKSPHIGRIAAVSPEGFFRIIRDGEEHVYPALYDPAECQITQQ